MSWIDIVHRGTSESGKTDIWEVREAGTRTVLGEVRWWSTWRSYAFLPSAYKVFEQACLREIAQFVENATQAHRRAAKATREQKKPPAE